MPSTQITTHSDLHVTRATFVSSLGPHEEAEEERKPYVEVRVNGSNTRKLCVAQTPALSSLNTFDEIFHRGETIEFRGKQLKTSYLIDLEGYYDENTQVSHKDSLAEVEENVISAINSCGMEQVRKLDETGLMIANGMKTTREYSIEEIKSQVTKEVGASEDNLVEEIYSSENRITKQMEALGDQLDKLINKGCGKHQEWIDKLETDLSVAKIQNRALELRVLFLEGSLAFLEGESVQRGKEQSMGVKPGLSKDKHQIKN